MQHQEGEHKPANLNDYSDLTGEPLMVTQKGMASPQVGLNNPHGNSFDLSQSSIKLVGLSVDPTDSRPEEQASPDPLQLKSPSFIEEESAPEEEAALAQARKRQQQMMRQYQQLNANPQPVMRSEKRIPTMRINSSF